jgi:sulfate permease, SulP family
LKPFFLKRPASIPLYLARDYFKHSFRHDLIAGVTVALVALPQAMAYATIAGVNPVNGIYTAIVPTLVGALFGSSSFLITGPSNASSMVTYSVLALAHDPAHFIELVFSLAILSGIIKLLLGLLRMGGIINYISNSVLTGFLGAIGILITLQQFGNLFGIEIPKNQGALAILIETGRQLPKINLFVLVTALTCIGFMLFIRILDRRLPSAMAAIIFSAIFVQLLNWHTKGVKLVGDLGIPKNPGLSIHVPQASLANLFSLLPMAGAVALFSLIEAMSIARALSVTSGEKIDPSREFIGQGLASIAGGFMQCIPSSGSPSRSAVNYKSGAKTRLAAAFSGGTVLIMLVLFSAWIGYIPMPGLAGVVIVSALGLIDRKHIVLTWNTRAFSRLIMVVTFGATLLLPLQNAIYVGVLLTIAIHLYESGHLHLSYLIINNDDRFMEKPIQELFSCCPKTAIIDVEGEMSFGAVEQLETIISRCQNIGIKVLILRLRRMRLLSSTGIVSLQGLINNSQKAGMTIILSEVGSEAYHLLENSKIIQLIGEVHIFKSTEIMFESTRLAMEYANGILANIS